MPRRPRAGEGAVTGWSPLPCKSGWRPQLWSRDSCANTVPSRRPWVQSSPTGASASHSESSAGVP